MPVAAVFHQPQCFDRDLARRHRGGIRRHDLAQGRADGALSLGKHTVNGVTACEYADEARSLFATRIAPTRLSRIRWQASRTVALGGSVTGSWLLTMSDIFLMVPSLLSSNPQ